MANSTQNTNRNNSITPLWFFFCDIECNGSISIAAIAAAELATPNFRKQRNIDMTNIFWKANPLWNRGDVGIGGRLTTTASCPPLICGDLRGERTASTASRRRTPSGVSSRASRATFRISEGASMLIFRPFLTVLCTASLETQHSAKFRTVHVYLVQGEEFPRNTRDV